MPLHYSLMPMLAALLGDQWDQRWAPYASLLTLELYAAAPGQEESFYFRLVYNGQELQLPACGGPLCGAKHLLAATAFADVAPCGENQWQQPQQQAQRYVIRFGDWDFFIVVALSGMLGALVGASVVKCQAEKAGLESWGRGVGPGSFRPLGQAEADSLHGIDEQPEDNL